MDAKSIVESTVQELEGYGFSCPPKKPLELLGKYSAPPRLIAHHVLVHDVAAQLVSNLLETWPDLEFDRNKILLGASTHDIGKVLACEELSATGNAHEELGYQLLIESSIHPDLARFTRTHGQGFEADHLEDLVVCVADKCWKGKRDEALEEHFCEVIGAGTCLDYWDVFPSLMELLDSIAAEGDRRLAIQSQFPCSG